MSEENSLEPLVKVVKRLLAPDGCPWDREQDHFTLRSCLLEETYEVIEAINSENKEWLKEELGDLLLQIVFHALLAEEKAEFNLREVIAGITEKMIRRHPHVFGEVVVADSAEVLENWEEIKKAEKGREKGVLGELNRALPALLLAEEVQAKVKKVGFDWEDLRGPLAKVKEELQELEEALAVEGNKQKVEEELGDLLFAVVNVARFVNLSPEVALLKTITKFIRRFNYLEREIMDNNLTWEAVNLQYLDEIWEKAKIKGL